MKDANINMIAPRAWVVFSGQTDLKFLKFLRPGFRHCFVLLNDGKCWVSVDPMSHYTEILVHEVNADFDLPTWLEKRGHSVVLAPVNHSAKKPAPFGIFSCVEAVKRLLGIHALTVVTPWQLYRYLIKTHNEKEIFHGKSSIPA